MDLEIDHLRKILAQIDGLHLVGQQTMVSNDSGELMDLIESAPDLDDPDPFDLCLQGELKAHLAEAISKLSEREQLILSLYYREELTMKEISEVVGVALSRISQIRQASMKKLRVSLAHLRERTVTANTHADPFHKGPCLRRSQKTDEDPFPNRYQEDVRQTANHPRV
jgi:RNA polymerase sigma factor for flagellar operon FliA